MLSILLSVVLVSVPSAHAFLSNAKMPVCLDGSEEMSINNDQVLRYKTSTKNNFHARGFVKGTVIAAPSLKNGHDHFAISIGSGSKDTLEIVYNYDPEFGQMSDLNPGDEIIVCGDYITSYAKSGGYEASPEGALIHWSHYNPGNRDTVHEHGFIMSGDTLSGFDQAPQSAWDGTITGPGGNGGYNRNGGYQGGNRNRRHGYNN